MTRGNSFLVGVCAAGFTAALALADPATGLPDPSLTPGATNPEVTEDTIASTICRRGWAASVRPPLDYSRAIKTQMLADPRYGAPAGARLGQYELDHLIAIELGGSPTDVANLWLQPWEGPTGARAKDKVEDALRRMVCRGEMTLTEAQRLIASNWTLGLKYVGRAP